MLRLCGELFDVIVIVIGVVSDTDCVLLIMFCSLLNLFRFLFCF